MKMRGSVLICEDDPLQQEILKVAFLRAGYEARVAAGPAEAKRLLQQSKADALVVDVQLNGGNGFDLAEDLRSTHLDAPKIMISAYGTKRMRQKALEVTARELIEKPFPIPRLIASIDKAMKESSQGG